MSKPKMKGNNLPSLQKLIVLHLAETEPQTMHETSEKISKSYKPTWTAFKSLEKKNLIKKTSLTKSHQRQKYPLYWLTDEGITSALLEGASPDNLLKQTKMLYPNAEATQAFLEIAPFLHSEVLKIAHTIVKKEGKLGINEIIVLYLSQPQVAMDDKPAKKVTEILKKYPNLDNIFKNAVQKMIKRLTQLITE